jgi:curved DNA-binding protein CbpA
VQAIPTETMHTDANHFYAILGVAPTASEHVIRAAFRRRAKEVHPDVTGHTSADFVALKRAYDVLSDSSSRAAYDRQCSQPASAPFTASPEPPFPPAPPVIRRSSNVPRFTFAFTAMAAVAFIFIWLLSTLAAGPPSSSATVTDLRERSSTRADKPSASAPSEPAGASPAPQQPTLFFWEQPRSAPSSDPGPRY